MQVHTVFSGWRRWLMLLPVLCCLSCSSGGLNSVHGKLLYKDEQIEGVVVTFHPKRADMHTLLPVGQTQEDGTFTLMTGKKEGAPVGEYVVTFTCPQGGAVKGQKGKPKKMVSFNQEEGFMGGFVNLEDRFKGVYANEAKSTVKVEIKKGTNQLEPFNLK